MRKNARVLILLLSFPIFFITTKSDAQIEFEKGYILTLDNQKVECLLKNGDWRDSPKKIEYKLSEDTPTQTGDAHSIKEFGIYGYFRYIGVTVKMDRSSDNNDLNKLSFQRSPEWSEETIFLKFLVEGKASLLYYSEGNLKRYFYKSPDTLEQLIYKKYLTQSNKVDDDKPHNQYFTTRNRVAVNISYKQQLFLHTKDCESFSTNSVKGLLYNTSDLTNFFKKYNLCLGGDPVNAISNATDTNKRNPFDFKIFTSIDYTKVSVEDYQNVGKDKSRSVGYDGKVGLSFGLETEFILPFNKNKWEIFLGTNYQHYSDNKMLYNRRSDNNLFDTLTYSTFISYSSLEIPIGVRYYSFLNKKSRLFIDVFYVRNLPLGSTIDNGNMSLLVIAPAYTYGFGAGFDFLNFSSEIRYTGCNDLLRDQQLWKAPYSRISLLIGYRLFRKSNK